MALLSKQPSPSDLKEGPKVGLKLPNQHPPLGGCFFVYKNTDFNHAPSATTIKTDGAWRNLVARVLYEH